MCEKGSIFQWNDECEQVFIRLKDVLTSPGRHSQFFFKISEFIRLGSIE
jgi:hypothetical protein